MRKNKLYCQPLTLSRLNLWLWTTCILLLGIILQLEVTDHLNLWAVGLGAIYIALVIYLIFSSYFTVNKTPTMFAISFPFSRRDLNFELERIEKISHQKRTITVHFKSGTQQRFLLTPHRVEKLIKLWGEL